MSQMSPFQNPESWPSKDCCRSRLQVILVTLHAPFLKACKHFPQIVARQMRIGVHGGLDLRVPETPLNICWILSGPQQIGCVRVAEHVWCGVQARPGAELAE